MDEHPTEHDWERLRASLAAGRASAFAELYEQLGQRLFRTALAIVARRDDAEDCVQETFAALVRSQRSLAAARDVPAYVFATLRRVALRQAARNKNQPGPLLADPAGRAEPAEDPRRQALARALRGLPHEQREVIALKIEGQLTFAEIGRVLAISANTAASRYRYALDKLRDRLGDC